MKKEPISIPLRKHFGFKPLCGERAKADQAYRENFPFPDPKQVATR